MKLFRKIKNIKRHKRNKHLRNLADNIFTAARYGDEMIVSSKIYNIIYFRNSHVPSNIKEFGGMKNDMTIMTVPKELGDFTNDFTVKYDELFGLFKKEPSEECKEQLSNIPLSQFVYPEVFAPKLDTIKPKLGE